MEPFHYRVFPFTLSPRERTWENLITLRQLVDGDLARIGNSMSGFRSLVVDAIFTLSTISLLRLGNHIPLAILSCKELFLLKSHLHTVVLKATTAQLCFLLQFSF